MDEAASHVLAKTTHPKSEAQTFRFHLRDACSYPLTAHRCRAGLRSGRTALKSQISNPNSAFALRLPLPKFCAQPEQARSWGKHRVSAFKWPFLISVN